METFLPLRYQDVTLEALTEYGRELVRAGFEVWVTPFDGCGYLTYAKNGNYGYLQCSYFGGWAHDMPIPPSRKYGNSMYIQNPLPVWTVEAAEQCAQTTNRNDSVGTQRNAGSATWISPHAERLSA